MSRASCPHPVSRPLLAGGLVSTSSARSSDHVASLMVVALGASGDEMRLIVGRSAIAAIAVEEILLLQRLPTFLGWSLEEKKEQE